jgi:hypothetical protein
MARRKHSVALCLERALEEAVDLSHFTDEWMNELYLPQSSYDASEIANQTVQRLMPELGNISLYHYETLRSHTPHW